MLLVVDVGNTNAVLGIYNKKDLIASWRVATDVSKTEDELGILINDLLHVKDISPKDVTATIISSVVPPLTPNIVEMCRHYLDVEPLLIGPGLRTGLNIKYENPKEVGADRIVNAVAGLNLYGGPLIIVDFGTATTFCAVSGDFEYLGGIICPGINISAEALFSRASKLPKVEVVQPERVIGKNTPASIQSGLYYGYTSQVDGLVNKMKKELAWQRAKVVFTGGLGGLLASGCESVDIVNPNLTLDGLRMIYELNQNDKQ
ncbi:MAG: type III pantothenate kinase [Firmicutes bacterium]|nr:type III pantothenate kinase [Bacillota bacterium]MDD4693582.1 type III pantothenate kinase [Bacillota bacterium]